MVFTYGVFGYVVYVLWILVYLKLIYLLFNGIKKNIVIFTPFILYYCWSYLKIYIQMK